MRRPIANYRDLIGCVPQIEQRDYQDTGGDQEQYRSPQDLEALILRTDGDIHTKLSRYYESLRVEPYYGVEGKRGNKLLGRLLEKSFTGEEVTLPEGVEPQVIEIEFLRIDPDSGNPIEADPLDPKITSTRASVNSSLYGNIYEDFDISLSNDIETPDGIVIPHQLFQGTFYSSDCYYVKVYVNEPTLVHLSARLAAAFFIQNIYIAENPDLSPNASEYQKEANTLLNQLIKQDIELQAPFKNRDLSPQRLTYDIDVLGGEEE